MDTNFPPLQAVLQRLAGQEFVSFASKNLFVSSSTMRILLSPSPTALSFVSITLTWTLRFAPFLSSYSSSSQSRSRLSQSLNRQQSESSTSRAFSISRNASVLPLPSNQPPLTLFSNGCFLLTIPPSNFELFLRSFIYSNFN